MNFDMDDLNIHAHAYAATGGDDQGEQDEHVPERRPRAEMTFEEIGDALGISTERVRQIYDRAMAKLRRGSNRVELQLLINRGAL